MADGYQDDQWEELMSKNRAILSNVKKRVLDKTPSGYAALIEDEVSKLEDESLSEMLEDLFDEDTLQNKWQSKLIGLERHGKSRAIKLLPDVGIEPPPATTSAEPWVRF